MSNEIIELKKGTVLKGRYEILCVLGQGGFGIVYKAIDRLLSRFVAIKSSCTSLSKEAKLLKEIDNVPYISHIYDYFQDNKYHYIVMRFIEGSSLTKIHKDHDMKIPVKELRPMLTSLCMALSQMHNKGVIHRDISPGNLMLTDDGSLYLIDFGTATSITNSHLKNLLSFSHKGLDAPERTVDGLIGPGTDIYSLCATIIYLISGEGIPAPSDRAGYDPLPALLPRLSLNNKQQNALLRGLNMDINKRYHSVSDFFQDFEGNDNIYGNSDIKYTVTYAAKTEVGKRNVNQDNFMIDSCFSYAGEDCQIEGTFPSSASHIHICAIADGVSSSCYGEFASKAAIQAVSHFIDSFRYSDTLPDRLLEDLLDQLNEKIITLGTKIGKTATTISILMWKNNHYYVANIGDSPVYIFKKGKLTKLFTPHTKAHEKMFNSSDISVSDYHTITRYLGKENIAGSQMASFTTGILEGGDTFFLCSDGISNIGNDEIFKKCIKKGGNKALDALWKYAAKSPQQDNCSAIILNFK